MNTKFCKTTTTFFKSLIFLCLAIVFLSSCEKNDIPADNVDFSTETAIFSTLELSTVSYISISAKTNIDPKYLSDLQSCGFEYSAAADFSTKESIIVPLDELTTGTTSNLLRGTISNLLYYKKYYVRAFAKQRSKDVTGYSKTKTFITSPKPQLEKGAKFLIGYNDSLFTANLDGSDFKFICPGRNIGYDGKIIQIGDRLLRNFTTGETIRELTVSKEDTYTYRITDFSADGSMFIVYNKYQADAVYKNNAIITESLGANGYGDKVIETFSKDYTKVVYEKGWGNISVYDLSNNTSISITNWGVGELNQSNTKVVFSTGGYSNYGGGLFWMYGSLKICNAIENGGANSTALISYDLEVTNNPMMTTHPIFSDDENIIYFLGRTPGNGWDIYSIPVSGGTPTKITNQPIDFTKVSGSVLFKLVNFE